MQNIKCVVVGDGGVGKTSMLYSYTKTNFPDQHLPTRFDNYQVDIVVDSKRITLALFDIAGLEDLDRLRPLVTYPHTDVFLVCFSIAGPTSLSNIKSKWLPEIAQHAPQAAVILVGTKTDLYKNKARTTLVKEKEITKLMKEAGLKTQWKCSSLTHEGLKGLFEEAARVVMHKQRAERREKRRKQGCIIS